MGREPGDKTRDNQEKSLRLVPETVFSNLAVVFPVTTIRKPPETTVSSVLAFCYRSQSSTSTKRWARYRSRSTRSRPITRCSSRLACVHLDDVLYSRWRCVQHPQSIPGPRSTPITLYPSALSTRLSTLPTLNTLAPTLRPHPSHPHTTPTARSAYPQHPQHPQRRSCTTCWQVLNRSPSLRSTV